MATVPQTAEHPHPQPGLLDEARKVRLHRDKLPRRLRGRSVPRGGHEAQPRARHAVRWRHERRLPPVTNREYLADIECHDIASPWLQVHIILLVPRLSIIAAVTGSSGTRAVRSSYSTR